MGVQEKILILNAEASNVLPFLMYYHKLGYLTFIGSSLRLPVSVFSKFNHIFYLYPNTGYLSHFGKTQLENKKQIINFIEAIKNFLQKNNIKLLISLYEDTLIPILLFYDELNIKPIYPSLEIVQKLHDKLIMYRVLEKLSTKSFFLPKIYSKKTTYPCVVRPSKGVGSQLVFVCKDKREIRTALYKLKKYGRVPLIQEYISPEKKFTMNLLIDRKGKIVRSVISQKISKTSIKKILEELEVFFKSIGYFGFASPQFIISEEKIYLTEINPRLSYNFYGLDFGINFPKAFHNAIIENKNIKKKTAFLKNFPNFWKSSKLYFKMSKDFMPVCIMLEQYLKWKLLYFPLHI
jgi:predicted ATP-grasp superfamily ATP-dependent carboligase